MATVDSTGLVSGVAQGETSVLALIGGLLGAAPVRVVASGPSVTLSVATDTVAVGGSVTLSARITDQGGTPIPDAVPTWASLDTVVAAVDTAGRVAGRSVGSAQVVASFDSAADTATIVVVAPAAGITKTWLGGSSDWHDATNWSPTGVPTATDTVFVPVTSNAPSLSSDQTIAAYLQEVGASLDLGSRQLYVTGYVAPSAHMVGTGWLQVGGDPRGIGGTFPNLRVVGGTSLNGATGVAGQTDVTGGGAVLELGGQNVTVDGAFQSQYGNTLLRMVDAADTLLVHGDVLIDGADTNGQLSAGVIDVRGNFNTGGTHSLTYRPTGTHKVVLRGSNPQTVNFAHTSTGSYFLGIEIVNAAGATFLSSLNVTGGLTITGLANVNSGRVVDVFGHLDIRSGGTLANSGTVKYGTFTNNGTVTGNPPVAR